MKICQKTATQATQGHDQVDLLTLKGFFVDWDGNTRHTNTPGDDLTCHLEDHQSHICVCVANSDGEVIHEADFHPTLESLYAAGVVINLV